MPGVSSSLGFRQDSHKLQTVRGCQLSHLLKKGPFGGSEWIFFFFAVLQTVLKCYRGLPDIPNGQYSPHYKKATFMCLLNLLFSSKVKHETRALLYHKGLWYPLPRGQHRCIIKVQKSKEIQNLVITIMNCI